MQSLADDAPVAQPTRKPASRELVVLERDECFTMIRERCVGRIAVVDREDLPFVVPVNYVVVRDTVVFRTHPGTKLDGLRRRPVAFQVDSIDEVDRTGWSVLIQGVAHEAAPHDLDVVDPEPWAEPGPHWIQVVPRFITGRCFALADP